MMQPIDESLRNEIIRLLLPPEDAAQTADQAAQLDTALRDTPAARLAYLCHIELLGSVYWNRVAESRDAVVPLTGNTRQTRRWFSTSRLIAIAASLLLVGYFVSMAALLMWDRLHRADNYEQLARQSLKDIPALLSSADDATWTEEQTLQVRSGLAELKFAEGARVVVEGPAEFQVRSSTQGFLRYGRLVATVPPPAVGFTVDTPYGQVVDRGTEFGLQADADGHTEVHVFRGSVDWQPSNRNQGAVSVAHPRRLVAGEAITIESATNGEQDTKADTSKFARALAAPQSGRPLAAAAKKLSALPELPIRDTLLLWLDANKILHADDANPASGEVLTRWANQANVTDDGMISDASPISSAGSPKYLSRTAARLAGVRFTGDQEQGQCLQVTCTEPLPPPYTIFVTAIILGNSQSNATDVLFDSPDPLKPRVAMGINPTGLAHDAMYFVPDQSAVVPAPWKQQQWQTWRLYEAVCHPNSVELLVNGKSIAKLAVTAGPLNQLWFGSRCNGKHFLNGVLSEVLIYGSVLSPDQRAAVEQYSFRKWGLAEQ